MKRFHLILTAVLLSFVMSSMAQAYCIITNAQGYYRKYLDTDIPFVYQPHTSTPNNYIPAIDAGADTWTEETASFWVFERGDPAPNSNLAWDGVNLIFFDPNNSSGIFPPGTDAIAASQTWTIGSGPNYRADESDLVWNSRDYTPSPNGAPGQYDIQSIVTHEFGHHLGLGHQGTPGSPPGCGETIQQAVMYGYAYPGDTSHRDLHVHDIAGVASIYPVWQLGAFVINADTGQPIADAELSAGMHFAATIDDVQGTNFYQRPGYVHSTLTTGATGIVEAIIFEQEFTLTVSAPGFESMTMDIAFDDPAGIGQTQTLQPLFPLSPLPEPQIWGTVTDSITVAPIQAQIDVYQINGPTEPVATTFTDEDGNFLVTAPPNHHYRVQATPVPPYPVFNEIVTNLQPAGAEVHFQLNPADVMFVNDDPNGDHSARVTAALAELSIKYVEWKTADLGSDIPLDAEPGFRKNATIWLTGDATSNVLSSEEQTLLTNYVMNGGNLFLTGQNIAEDLDSAGSTFLSDVLQVEYIGNTTDEDIFPVDGNPITEGLGPGEINGSNQISMDAIEPLADGAAMSAFTYLNNNSAIVTVDDPSMGGRIVFTAFGFEGLRNVSDPDQTNRTRLMENVLGWLDDAVAIEAPETEVVLHSHLLQNYPNPFNPTTTIQYQLEQPGQVLLRVFNTAGQEVRRLVDTRQSAGHHDVQWDGRNSLGESVASGVYLYRLESDIAPTLQKRMVLLK